MTRISPGLLARIVDALAPRVRKRVDAYLAEGVEAGPATRVAGATVRLADVGVLTEEDQIVCDCLLAPRCAHRAVVALSLEVAGDGPEAGGGGEERCANSGPAPGEDPAASGDSPAPGEAPAGAPAGGSGTGSPTAPAGSGGGTGGGPTGSGCDAATGGAPLSAAQRATADAVLDHLGEILQVGAARMGSLHRAMVAKDLHALRLRGFVTADRALTAFLSSLGAAPAPRAAAFASAALNLHLLTRPGATADPALLGRARQGYREVGGLSLTPLYAEPVLAASGFAGAQAVFTDSSGATWSVARVRPGDASSIPAAYAAEPVWQELSAPIRQLSRHRLLVARASARGDGRLSAGAAVRASMGAAHTGWEGVPGPFEVVEGPVSGGDRRGIVVAGRSLALREAARALGAGLAAELFGLAVGARVRCLVLGGELLGMTAREGAIHVPDDLGGVWWPGLDRVTRSWVGALPEGVGAPRPGDGVGASGPSQVREVVGRWCQRVLDAGSSVLASPALERDRAWAVAAGAPFAARLLGGMEAATHQGSRRFDGTWEADAPALLVAWLAASQY